MVHRLKGEVIAKASATTYTFMVPSRRILIEGSDYPSAEALQEASLVYPDLRPFAIESWIYVEREIRSGKAINARCDLQLLNTHDGDVDDGVTASLSLNTAKRLRDRLDAVIHAMEAALHGHVAVQECE